MTIFNSDAQWDDIPGFDRDKGTYTRLDTDAWLRKHHIREDGRERGERNFPPADQSEMDDIHIKTLAWVNRRGLQCKADVNHYLSDFVQQLNAYEDEEDITIHGHRVTEIANDARISFNRRVEHDKTKLTRFKTAIREGTDEYERFRKKAGLDRLPDYADRRNALLVILFCATVETVLNASLLMEVNPFGLLGSFMQMGLITAVNILVGALVIGYALRSHNLPSQTQKVSARLVMGVSIILIGTFNLLAGHFRDSMQAVILDGISADPFAMLQNDVLPRIMNAPFGFDSFQSILLVLLGMIFFGIASWKGYRSDDPYPGYGRRDRQLSGIKDNYSNALKKAQDGIKKEHDEYISKLEDIRHDIEIKRSTRMDLCDRGARIVEQYPANLRQYQEDLNYLVAAYRTENQQARTEPSPPFFNEQLTVDQDILIPPSFEPPDQMTLEVIARNIHEAITSTQKAYEDASSEYRTLEDITAEGFDRDGPT